jgi:hypothetical protein
MPGGSSRRLSSLVRCAKNRLIFRRAGSQSTQNFNKFWEQRYDNDHNFDKPDRSWSKIYHCGVRRILFVLQNVTLASTTGSPIGFGITTDVEVTILGTLIATTGITLPTNSSFPLAVGGSYMAADSISGTAALFLSGGNSAVETNGHRSAPETIAILSAGGMNTVTVTGSISG